ncbi:MAG: succinyl-diaminopimelate desuccinylase [Geodermatophilaceae bacterium]|nr:succinyl-diaminopimelate desuccinylase [Geodermatophilaceae bacterium]
MRRAGHPGHGSGLARLADVFTLDLSLDVVSLTRALVDLPSVSGDERVLADAVEEALRGLDRLDVRRDGDTVVARTTLGRDQRIVLAGHLDTVPIADNLPSHDDGELLYGCGASDMKSGVAVMLRVAHNVVEPVQDLTWIFYDNEEVESSRNGLARLARNDRSLLYGDLAVLLEPTGGVIEAGCQGTLRAAVRTSGHRAHSARSWLGANAIHAAAPILATLEAYPARTVDIDDCTYREGLNAVRITGGVAGNVIPDLCEVEVNFRFAPDRSIEQATEHVREVFRGFDIEITDAAPGALPGLSEPAAGAFIAALEVGVQAKLGWTDVARFAAFGIPAVNFGPGDPNLAHKREEHVRMSTIRESERLLSAHLAGSGT